MNSPFTKLLLLATAQVSGYAASAQTVSRLSGTLTDSLTHQPLPYVTVLAQPQGQNQVIATAFSNEQGVFSFENLPAGSYRLSGKYLGYRDFASGPVPASGEVPAITLAPDRKMLKGVVVVGTKPFIEMQANKFVLNVASSPIAAGSTADEVLARAPGVVESGTGYSVRGRASTVLLDGKPTNLSGDDLKAMLATLPSNTVDKIEVLTTPSAKYDAQGGTVINIITTRSRAYGTNGTFVQGLGTGRHARYNTGLTLNYRQDRLALYGGYDYLRTKQYVQSTSQRSLGAEAQVDEKGNLLSERQNHALKAGLDYELSKTATVGLLLRGQFSQQMRDGFTNSLLANPDSSPALASTVQTTGHTGILSPALNVYYKSTAGKPGTELRVNLDYYRFNRNWQDDFTTSYLPGGSLPLPATSYLRNNSLADNAVRSASIDYSRPLKKATLELGAKTIFTTTDNDIRWDQLQPDSWQPDTGKTNHFIYRENVNAAYANLTRKLQKLTIQAGLRLEQSNTEGYSLTTGQNVMRHYLNLFPSVSLDYARSDKHDFTVSYQRRIDRPRFNIVNPYVTYVSQYLYFQGNPYVLPSISDNYSFTHVYRGALSTTLSYGYYRNVLTEVFRPKDATAAVQTFESSAIGQVLDLSVSYSKALLAGKWNTTNAVDINYARIDANAGADFRAATPMVFLNTSNTVTLPLGLRLEVAANYALPYQFGAYQFRPRYATSLGVAKTVLQGAGTLTLNVSDVFNTLSSRYDVRSYGVVSSNEVKTESRFVRLNFSYRFGNKNVKAAKTRRTSSEVEQRRMEN